MPTATITVRNRNGSTVVYTIDQAISYAVNEANCHGYITSVGPPAADFTLYENVVSEIETP